MQPSGAKQLVVVELIGRGSAALLYLICNRFATKLLAVPETALGYYMLAVALALAMVGFVFCLGRSPLFFDLAEICLYDVGVAGVGLALKVLGYPPDIFYVFGAAVANLLFCRLVWWGKDETGALMAAWPIFGIIGAIRRPACSTAIPRRKKLAVYLLCCAALAVPAATWLIFRQLDVSIFIGPVLIALLLFTARVTEQIKAAEAAREDAVAKNAVLQARTELDASLKDRNEDLCHATHDVQKPVHTMIDLAKSLQGCTEPAQFRAAATRFEHGLAELSDKLDEIIVMARITTAMMTATDEVVDMRQLGDYFRTQYEPLAETKGIQFLVDDAPVKVASNAWLLQRIIANLLMNSFVHSDHKTNVRLWLYSNEKYCYIRVWDTGPGMMGANGPDRAANFTNLVNLNTRNQRRHYDEGLEVLSGHGLGLRSVQRMCHTLGITMTLISRPTKGSMFRFRVPLASLHDISAKMYHPTDSRDRVN
jgi:signal transduction histidine kinase